VDKGKLEHIGRFCEPMAMASGEQLGAAHRKQVLRAEPRHIKTLPVAVAMAHGEVDVLAREIDVMQCRGYAQVHAGILLGKPAETVDQPLGGKVR
jgi:hypothetical protein